MTEKVCAPVHPGKVLLLEFMEPLGLTSAALARDLNVPESRIGDLIYGRTAVTVDTARGLARRFNMTPEFWLNLQNHYEMEVGEDNDLPGRIQVETRSVASGA